MIKVRVKLIRMEDPYTDLKSGDEGTIEGKDGLGHLLVKWDNGSSLSLIPGIDEFEILEKKFIKSFESYRSNSNFIESKLEELTDLVGSFESSHFDWLVQNEKIEAEIEIDSQEVAIKWEIDLSQMIIEESTSHRGCEDVWFEKILSIDEGLDIIEKEIHYWLDISESRKSQWKQY
jgi:hypothetical protein